MKSCNTQSVLQLDNTDALNIIVEVEVEVEVEVDERLNFFINFKLLKTN